MSKARGEKQWERRQRGRGAEQKRDISLFLITFFFSVCSEHARRDRDRKLFLSGGVGGEREKKERTANIDARQAGRHTGIAALIELLLAVVENV